MKLDEKNTYHCYGLIHCKSTRGYLGPGGSTIREIRFSTGAMIRLRKCRLTIGTMGRMRGIKIWGTGKQVVDAIISSGNCMRDILRKEGNESVFCWTMLIPRYLASDIDIHFLKKQYRIPKILIEHSRGWDLLHVRSDDPDRLRDLFDHLIMDTNLGKFNLEDEVKTLGKIAQMIREPGRQQDGRSVYSSNNRSRQPQRRNEPINRSYRQHQHHGGNPPPPHQQYNNPHHQQSYNPQHHQQPYNPPHHQQQPYQHVSQHNSQYNPHNPQFNQHPPQNQHQQNPQYNGHNPQYNQRNLQQNPCNPPQNQHNPHQNQHNPPQNQYNPPQNQYNPPQNQQNQSNPQQHQPNTQQNQHNPQNRHNLQYNQRNPQYDQHNQNNIQHNQQNPRHDYYQQSKNNIPSPENYQPQQTTQNHQQYKPHQSHSNHNNNNNNQQYGNRDYHNNNHPNNNNHRDYPSQNDRNIQTNNNNHRDYPSQNNRNIQTNNNNHRDYPQNDRNIQPNNNSHRDYPPNDRNVQPTKNNQQDSSEIKTYNYSPTTTKAEIKTCNYSPTATKQEIKTYNYSPPITKQEIKTYNYSPPVITKPKYEYNERIPDNVQSSSVYRRAKRRPSKEETTTATGFNVEENQVQHKPTNSGGQLDNLSSEQVKQAQSLLESLSELHRMFAKDDDDDDEEDDNTNHTNVDYNIKMKHQSTSNNNVETVTEVMKENINTLNTNKVKLSPTYYPSLLEGFPAPEIKDELPPQTLKLRKSNKHRKRKIKTSSHALHHRKKVRRTT